MIYDYQRILTLRLLAWSAASVLVGIILTATGIGFWRGFGFQAIAWGAIDGIIAIFGLRATLPLLDLPVDLEKVAREARRLKFILWVNTGLDVLYVAGGWLLAAVWSRGDPFWVGSGWGIVLQGFFLFIFDLLHALGVPQERFMPRLGLFPAPAHEAFTLPGGHGAVLLVHGFPHSPDEMRPLAEALNAAGWTARSILLPGFGPQMDQLFQQRYMGWVDAILKELQHLKQAHSPVVLVGFSLGGGLSVLASSREQPDQLILIAPFWWESTRLTGLLLTAFRLLLPMELPMNQKAVFRLERAAESAGTALAGRLSSEALQSAIRNTRVPVIFLEQFLRFSARLRRAAAQVSVPVVAVQGASDETVLPRRSRTLVSWFPPGARLVEIPGDHFFIQRGNPHLPGLIQTVAQLLNEKQEG